MLTWVIVASIENLHITRTSSPTFGKSLIELGLYSLTQPDRNLVGAYLNLGHVMRVTSHASGQL
jgi:hypothetical protein